MPSCNSRLSIYVSIYRSIYLWIDSSIDRHASKVRGLQPPCWRQKQDREQSALPRSRFGDWHGKAAESAHAVSVAVQAEVQALCEVLLRCALEAWTAESLGSALRSAVAHFLSSNNVTI